MKKTVLTLLLLVSVVWTSYSDDGHTDTVSGFSEIIAPHKGKVIVVDFWNTWCPACCNALVEREELKHGKLKSKDIVWIYIADETSPYERYRDIIRFFKGTHYRLDKARMAQICRELGISSYPAYILVGRDGHYQLREDMKDRTGYINAIKTAISEP